MLPQDQRPPYACHQYRIRLCRKGECRTLSAKEAAKDRIGGGGKNKRKEKKGRRKTLLRLRIRRTEEDTPLGSVIL